MEPVTQDLHIIIIEALNLYGKDFDNKSTPIAKVEYGSQAFTTGKAMPEHTRNCIWSNSSCTFHQEQNAGTITFKVLASHVIKENKLIGEKVLDIDHLNSSVNELWFDLNKEVSKKRKNERGKLHVLIYKHTSFPPLVPQKNGSCIFFAIFDQLETMNTGDVLLFAGLGSKQICTASGSQYSHSALVLKPKDFDANFDGDEKLIYIIESTANASMDVVTGKERKGVAIRDAKFKINKYNGYGVWYLPLKDPLEGEDLKTMVAFMKDFHERNVQYDQFQSKLRIAGKINTQDLSEVYCSEFVAEGLVRAKRIPNAMASSNYLPVDIANLDCFGPIQMVKHLVYCKINKDAQ